MSNKSKEGERYIPEEVVGARNMSRLAIVRHGSYGNEGRLSNTGKLQMLSLGRSLAGTLKQNELALILTSPAPRAVDSSAILAKSLNAQIEEHEILWSDENHQEDLEKAHELVRAKKTRADLLVMVTHYEYADEFPGFLGEKDLDIIYRQDALIKGECVVLDYRNKSITKI